MPALQNPFKSALHNKDLQVGCWLGFADAYVAELMGTAGFDWLVVDGEHAPNDLRSIRDQLAILEHSPSHAVVRLPSDEVWMIKQALDAGAQTLLVPMVETAEQAAAIVAASKYPPEGIRGMGATMARASRFGEITDYATTANDEVAVIVQVETAKGMSNLAEIAATDGIDGVFIGPADLSADMGFPGNAGAPEVVAEIERAARVIAEAGKASGILALADETARSYQSVGYAFIAVGIDVMLLAKAARALAASWTRGS
ncbi:MAG: HpcH/HpaI aldolase/citrate lyase family protein [Pseudomonadota bacterium]